MSAMTLLICFVFTVYALGKSTFFGSRIGVREALVLGWVAVTLWLVMGTLIASVFNVFLPLTLTIWWVAGCVISTGFLIRSFWHPRNETIPNSPRSDVRGLPLEWDCKLILCLCILLSASTLLVALLCAPNNVDSMIYHLPRQIFWMAEKSVFLKNAPHEFHLKMPPLAEYIQSHLFLLAGSDRFLNIPQWVSYILVAVLLTLIVEMHGGGVRQQLLAAAFFLSLPAAFFQATNTKNDLVLCFFLLLTLWASQCIATKTRSVWLYWMVLGSGVGCALLSKGTALVYLPPLALLIATLWINKPYTIQLKGVLAACFLALLIASPHWISMADRIAAAETGSGSQHANASFSLQSTLSVLVRNAAVQLATPVGQVNQAIEHLVVAFHNSINQPLNSPDSTFLGTAFRVIYRPQYEDEATAAIHFLLLLGMPLFALMFYRSKLAFAYSLVPLLCLFLFSFLLRWQPWHSRLLIPCVALASVPFALIFGQQRLKVLSLILVLACVAWLVPSIDNAHRSLIGGHSVFSATEDEQRSGYNAEMEFGTQFVSKIVSVLDPASVCLDSSVLYPFLLTLKKPDGSWPVFARDLTDKPCLVMGNSFSDSQMTSCGYAPLFKTRGITIWVDREQSCKLRKHVSLPFYGNEQGISKIYKLSNKDGGFFYRQLLFPEATFNIPTNERARQLKLSLSFLDPNVVCDVLVNGRKAMHLQGQPKNQEVAINLPAGSSSITFSFRRIDDFAIRKNTPVAMLFECREHQ